MPRGEKPAPATLFLRLLCGGYLIYLAYSLWTEAAGSVVFRIAAAVFALAGAALAVLTLRGVLKGRAGEGGGEDAPPPSGGPDETDGKE